jgi:hypothetical protein
MDQYKLFLLAAPVSAPVNTCHDRCANLSDSFICQTPSLLTAGKSHEVSDVVLHHLASEGTR